MWSGSLALWLLCLCGGLLVVPTRAHTDHDPHTGEGHHMDHEHTLREKLGCKLISREMADIDGCTIPSQTPHLETRCVGHCHSSSQSNLGYNPNIHYLDCMCCGATATSQRTMSMFCQQKPPISMTATCDNEMKVYFDGDLQGGSPSELNDWTKTTTFPIPPGTGTVTIECVDTGSQSGILASMDHGLYKTVTHSGFWTTGHWTCEALGAGAPAPAVEIGPNGMAPWGDFPDIESDARWIWTSGFHGGDLSVRCSKHVWPVGGGTPVYIGVNYTVIEECDCVSCEEDSFEVPTW